MSTVGHGAKRCPEPPKDSGAGGLDSGAGGFDAAPSVAAGDWETGANGSGDSSWAAAAPVAATTTVGGW